MSAHIPQPVLSMAQSLSSQMLPSKAGLASLSHVHCACVSLLQTNHSVRKVTPLNMVLVIINEDRP